MKDIGIQIVVLKQGFVYVGQVSHSDNLCIIDNAKNLRVWGTKKGLGELRHGPLNSTIADECGVVTAPMHAVIHFIKATGW